ncbi:uncharacterized protein LOC127243870 [Andrographis paniculata]|uniref:uncharacterized protein LOC127243870 n=1 Tax=Andrographis paniculata TaxID=175694 RepID=UPI0021E73367|nr:uncharacterized protein LOC127243870 [Andrographis paniculata]XP_051120046.1 uncharacterized protein LOC127243870 [Andrographis paniculata]
MDTIKGSWSGQVVALAANNDSKKSRIRRSKEERKEMVESFIKRYQSSNAGNFPSLNLTHKEVGGSFYTVREIVREIIQENRVLAPPKLSLGQEHSEFLEQHPLGSISMEPRMDLLTLNGSSTITSEGSISSLELDNEQFTEIIKIESEEVSNRKEQLDQHEPLENGKIVNGDVEMLEDNSHPDLEKSIDVKEQILDEADRVVEKSRGFTQRIIPKPVFFENLDRERNGDALLNGASLNPDIVVEKFPLRPVSCTIHDVDGEFEKVHNPIVKTKDKHSQDDQSKLHLDDAIERESKTALHKRSQAGSSTEHNSTSARRNFNDLDYTGNLNRETPMKSTGPENNPLVALLKGIASFFKFWTE